MQTMKSCALAVACLAFSAALAAPSLSDVSVSQSGSTRDITVSYTVSGGPAIVTVEFFTNSAPVDVSRAVSLGGDFGKKVEDGSHSILWRAGIDLPKERFAAGAVTAKLTSWPVDNPPDYLVVNLASNCVERVRYYATVDALPGGLLSNDLYRTTHVVMRRIHAKGVRWVMGSTCTLEPGYYAGGNNYYIGGGSREAVLDEDFYIGVFELSASQWYECFGDRRNSIECLTSSLDAYRRSASKVYYGALRGTQYGGSWYCYKEDDDPVAPPPPTSMLGVLRSRTGVDFDLPTEGEWEFACLSGQNAGYWNDGTPITNSVFEAGVPGRYTYTSTNSTDSILSWYNGQPAPAGLYAPNAFGLYDMHGNVMEWCRDFSSNDVVRLAGALNTNKVVSTTSGHTSYCVHILKGGYYGNTTIQALRATYRTGESSNNAYQGMGCRLRCPVTLVENR